MVTAFTCALFWIVLPCVLGQADRMNRQHDNIKDSVSRLELERSA